MVKLATSLQHQIRYDYNRSTELRPTMPTNVAFPTTFPPPSKEPSATYIQHITVAWDTMHTQVILLIAHRRSVAKNVGCFQRRLFDCLFVCQHNNFRTSKHRMMKLGEGGRCTVQKSWPSLNFGVIARWMRTPKNVTFGYDVGKISAGCLVLLRYRT